MMVRTLSLLIVLIAIGAFAALNWTAFMAPATLSSGLTTVEASGAGCDGFASPA